MTDLLKTSSIANAYEIYFAHQHDERSFNRGGAKNIGFLAMRDKYPNDYQNITFVFNDIDTVPFADILNYATTSGTVKHFYGFTHALGGIVAITGHDFERINGFPSYWGWGMEDNVLQSRCDRAKIAIDRSTFFKIGSPQILQLFDGVSRIINKDDPWRSKTDTGADGLTSIKNLSFSVSDKSTNETDNESTVENSAIGFVNIKSFSAHSIHDSNNLSQYDLRDPPRRYTNPAVSNMSSMGAAKPSGKIDASVEDLDWTHIPHKENAIDKLMTRANDLKRLGEIVPQHLNDQISQLSHKCDPLNSSTPIVPQNAAPTQSKYFEQFKQSNHANPSKRPRRAQNSNGLLQRTRMLGSMVGKF